MKRKQIAILQIISVFAICILVLLTVLYQKGYYDFTFIDRPSDENNTHTSSIYILPDAFTPTFQFGDQTRPNASPLPTDTTVKDNIEGTVPTETDTETETGEAAETEEETLPPLSFETETDPPATETEPETTDTEPETTDTEPESTDTPPETTDSPEETTGEGENTDAPESTDAPENTTGPEETTNSPTESETTNTPEQTTVSETTSGPADNEQG